MWVQWSALSPQRCACITSLAMLRGAARGRAPLSGAHVESHFWKSEKIDVTFEKYDSKDSLAFRANVGEVECAADLTPGILPLFECLNSASEGGSRDSASASASVSNEERRVLPNVFIDFKCPHLFCLSNCFQAPPPTPLHNCFALAIVLTCWSSSAH